MKKYGFFLLLFAIGLFACNSPQGESTAQSDNQEQHEGHDHEGHDHEGHDHGDEGAMAEGDGKHFGEEVNEDGAIGLGELMSQLENADSLNTKVKATVESVCQAKGCWMNLAVGEGESRQEIFVQFKDYGFFVPMDIAGREVVIEGLAYESLTSVEELRHYAEDEGQSPEEIESITEPLEEKKFLASGVLLLDPAEK
jgi:hypothetical protein